MDSLSQRLPWPYYTPQDLGKEAPARGLGGFFALIFGNKQLTELVGCIGDISEGCLDQVA